MNKLIGSVVALVMFIAGYYAYGNITASEKKYLNEAGSAHAKVQAGTLLDQTQGLVAATYDFAVDGGAIGAIDLGKSLPDNAIVTRAWYDIITAFVSSSGGGTVALHLNAADDMLVAVDADTLSGLGEGVPDDTDDTAKYVKLTAERALTLTIASEAMTAGKATFFVEYVRSELDKN